MPGIFDRLQKQLEIRKHEEGISAIELTDLPPNLRKIMRLMLREVVIKYTDLWAAIEQMDAKSRLSRAELDSALNQLVEQNWILRSGKDEFTSYRVNLRRKAGSQLSQDIWAALDSKIDTDREPNSPAGNDK